MPTGWYCFHADVVVLVVADVVAAGKAITHQQFTLELFMHNVSEAFLHLNRSYFVLFPITCHPASVAGY